MRFCLYLTIYGIIYLMSNSIPLFTKYGEGGIPYEKNVIYYLNLSSDNSVIDRLRV